MAGREGSIEKHRPPPSARRYSEQEFARILHTAMERHDHAGAGPSSGLSLDEMKAIAREVGVDPALVESAAAEVDALPTAPRRAWWAGPAARFRARSVVSGSLDDDARARVIAVVRERVGVRGEVYEELGQTVWTAPQNQSHLAIASEGDHTALELTTERGPVRGLLTVLPTLFGMIAAGAVGSSLQPSTGVGVVMFAGITLAAFAAGQVVWAVLATRSDRRLTQTLQDATRVAATLGQSTAEGGDRGAR
jgi:hypothetical protein